MFTPNRALQLFVASIFCCALLLLAGGSVYAQTAAINTNLLAPADQGIMSGSGPTEVLGIDATSPNGNYYRLEQVILFIADMTDLQNEIDPTDFDSIEIWSDNVPIGGRDGVFDPPGGEYIEDIQLATTTTVLGAVPGGFIVQIDVLPQTNEPDRYAPQDNAGANAGNDFFVVIRSSQTMDSATFFGADGNLVDKFSCVIEPAESREFPPNPPVGGITFAQVSNPTTTFVFPPVAGTTYSSPTLTCETMSLDLRPIPMSRSNEDTADNPYPGNFRVDLVGGTGRYGYGIMGQSIRLQYLGERDRDATGISQDVYTGIVYAIEQPVVELIERQEQVLGIDVAGGTPNNPELLVGFYLTLSNFGTGISGIEFIPERDLDYLIGSEILGPSDLDFSGLAVYQDTNNNGTFEADVDTPIPFTTYPGLYYKVNPTYTHYGLGLVMDTSPQSLPLLAVDDTVDGKSDFFITMRLDSGGWDDGPLTPDGTGVTFGTDFAISLERDETGVGDLNNDGLAQPSPVFFRFARPGDGLAIIAEQNYNDAFRNVRKLGAVAKVQNLAWDWGVDINTPIQRIPQRIDATCSPTALLGLNLATSDNPTLNYVDDPITLSEVRLNFSGIGFNPSDIQDIYLARDDKSPTIFGDLAGGRSIGVFDIFNDLLNQPIASALDLTNPEEDSPIELKNFTWQNDGVTDYVVLTPVVPRRIYPHDSLTEGGGPDTPASNFELIPGGGGLIPRDTYFAGADYFVAIVTSNTIGYGDEIKVDIPHYGMSSSNGLMVADTEDAFHPRNPRPSPGLPAFNSVYANVPVELTNLVRPGQVIGASSPHTAVIGLNMRTNQPYSWQGGVDVYFEQLIISFLQYGTRDSLDLAQVNGDFLPFEDMNGANTVNSGIQLYRDANGNGRFDGPAIDTLVNFDPTPQLGPNPSRFGEAGQEANQVLMIFSSPQNRQLVPSTDTGTDAGADFFLVLRTSSHFTPTEDNFSVAIVSWGPDSPSAPAPDTITDPRDTPHDALNIYQKYPYFRRGIGFVDSNGIRTRSNESINSETLNAALATWLEGVTDISVEFPPGSSSSHEFTLKFRDTNGQKNAQGQIINQPEESGYIIENKMFGIWMQVDEPIPPNSADADGIITVNVIFPTSFAGKTVPFRIYPYVDNLPPALDPPFNGPGPKIEFNVTFTTTPLPVPEGGGGGGGGGGGCFIATAAYGTDSADDVLLLREYRDSVLLHCAVGRAFVKLYYATSPSIASFIAERPLLRSIVRTSLGPVVAIAGVSMSASPAERSFFWLIFGVLLLSALVPLGKRVSRGFQRSVR